MSDKHSKETTSASRALGRALRSFGDSLEHLSDFRSFSAALEKAMSEALFLRRAVLHVANGGDSTAPPERFESGSLVLPLAGPTGNRGTVTIRARDGNGTYGPEDLRLISSLTSFCGSLVEHALQFADRTRNLAILQYILDQLPIPVAAADETGSILILNTRGASFLEVSKAAPGRLPAPFLEHLPGTSERNGGRCFSFCLARGNRLVRAAVSPCPDVVTEGKVFCMSLIDLAPERERLVQGLRREAYRCRWLDKPLTRVVLRNAADPAVLLDRLPELREHAGGEERAGPWDEASVALAFPESPRKNALRELRRWLRPSGSEGIELGVTEMAPDAENPEAVAEGPSRDVLPLRDFLRPAILLHDDSAEVNDALEYVLAPHYRVRKSHSAETALRLLEEELFDGFVTETSLRGPLDGVELARRAESANPDIHIFLTGTRSTIPPFVAGRFRRPPEAIRKPFDVRLLLETVQSRLGAPE